MNARVGIAAIGALLAVVLQVILAPNMIIIDTMPSFIITYSLVIAMLLQGTPSYVIVFCLGLAGDLLGYGPVGALSFILLLCAFLIEKAVDFFGNGTVFVTGVILVAFVFVVHFLHAGFMVAISSSYTAIDAFMLVAVPESLYDSVLAVLFYFLLRRILSPGQATMANIGPLSR